MIPLFPSSATAADTRLENNILYSICTLVTDVAKYAKMVASLEKGGFVTDTEYLYLDNTRKNSFDAYLGVNIFLQVARGTYIIICHQDVELITDGRKRLDNLLNELDIIDPRWGLAGNAGGLKSGRTAVRISDPWGENQGIDRQFPVRAVSLDENFIVIRKNANLAVSGDLTGFHLYGTDLCLVAARLGYNAYVIDFHLRHYGAGTWDSSFYEARSKLVSKMKAACRWQWMTTTCTQFPIMSSSALHWVAKGNRGLAVIRLLMKIQAWWTLAINNIGRKMLRRPSMRVMPDSGPRANYHPPKAPGPH